VLGKREGIEADWDAVFKTAAERKVLMEINGAARRQDLSDRMVRRAASFGLRFSLATDAHKLKDFNRMQWALGVARRAGLSAGQVVNASAWSAVSSPV
jgi:DNA polymerase (family 10)